MHWYGKSPPKPRRKMGHLNVIAESAAAAAAALLSLQGEGEAPPAAPRVGVIMGSDSDLGCMRAAAEVRETTREDLATPCNPARCWRLRPTPCAQAATPRQLPGRHPTPASRLPPHACRCSRMSAWLP